MTDLQPPNMSPLSARGETTPSEGTAVPAGADEPFDRQSPAPSPTGRPAYSPPARTPFVTHALLGLTIAIFLGQLITPFLFGYDFLVEWGVKSNALIVRGQLWRLFTPMLLHGGLLHIAFNMYALRVLGPGLEQHYGHWRFLALYVLAGFAGNVASFALSSADSLGASTSLFGLFGAEGVFLYQNRELFGERARAALNRVVTLAVINLVIGLSPGIDNWGHIGGLIGGVLFAWFAGPVLSLEGIAPTYSIKDRREPASVWLAAVGVGMLFTAIAAGVIFMRA